MWKNCPHFHGVIQLVWFKLNIECPFSLLDVRRSNSTVHEILKWNIRQIRQITTEQEPLLKFFESIIVPVIMYASPAWFGFIDSKSMNLLERIQRRCCKIIVPDDSKTYSDRLTQLNIPAIELRLQTHVTDYFKKIAADPDHCLHDRLSKPGRRSTRNKLPDISLPKHRTTKRRKSFLVNQCFKLKM
jgi:hypothetical protein